MTMVNFNAKISAELTPPKRWKLEKELSFKTHLMTKDEIENIKQIGVNMVETGRITSSSRRKTDWDW